jgi:hypothetical protein
MGLLWFNFWFLGFFEIHRCLRAALWVSELSFMVAGLGSISLLGWRIYLRQRERRQQEQEYKASVQEAHNPSSRSNDLIKLFC